MRNSILIRTLFFVMALAAASAASAAKISIENATLNIDRWVNSNFGKGKQPPFSFTYGGKPSSAFITSWRHSLSRTAAASAGTVRYTATYADPATGLTVECSITGFPDFDAVEWVLRLENKSSKPTPQITKVNAADIALAYGKSCTFAINYPKGSEASKSDFETHTATLKAAGDSLNIVARDGRSTFHYMPYFNVELPTKPSGLHQGVFCSVGWTGVWRTNLKNNGQGNLQFKAGQFTFDTFLEPGEHVRTPLTSIMLWQGDNKYAGNNKFRRFILAHHSPKVGGKLQEAPITAGFEENASPKPCKVYTCLTSDWAVAVMRRQQQFGIKPQAYWLDAGWYTGASEKGWYASVGDWEVDRVRFPQGLLPIAQEAHRLGCKFMVWFEPERQMPGTAWRKAHPSWMLHAGGDHYTRPQDDTDTKTTIINLGLPGVADWMADSIADIMEANGIDYYRQDYNIDPEGFWWCNETDGNRGKIEAKYIEGLYRFIDRLRERMPNAIIDNCAGGGRRLDIEMTSRSIPLWRTDYKWGEVNGYQCHTYNLALYLPQSGTASKDCELYNSRSCLGSALNISWKTTNDSVTVDDIKNRLKEYYELKSYYYEDYYPLLGTGNNHLTGEDVWLAYQLYRPSDATGYVVAYRRPENGDSTLTVKLFGLKPSADYSVTDIDTGISLMKTGKELMEQGLTINADKPRSAKLLFYQENK